MKNVLIERKTRQIPEVLDLYSEKLDELIDIISDILIYYNSKKKEGDYQLVPLLFLRNLIEVADSISILIKASSIEPIKILNRVILENNLQLEYLLEKNMQKRAYAFLVWSIHQDIEFYKKMKDGTTENINFKEKFNNDTYLNNFDALNKITVDQAWENANNILKLKEYENANNEYLKMAKKNKYFYWYSMYEGPRSISKLADYLKKSVHYEVFYRSLSNNIHATDIYKNKLLTDSNNIAHLTQIRLPINASAVLKDTINFMISCTLNFTKKLVPEKEKEFSVWYLGFQKFYLELSTLKDYTISR